MVLAEAMENSWGGLAAPNMAVSSVVRTRELDRRGVVVQPVQVDVESLDRVEDQPGEQAGPVRVEQPGEHPADPVIVEQLNICSRQADRRRLVAGSPLAQCVHRGVSDHQVADHHPKRRRR